MTPVLKAQFREWLMRDLAERSIPGIPADIALWRVILFATSLVVLGVLSNPVSFV